MKKFKSGIDPERNLEEFEYDLLAVKLDLFLIKKNLFLFKVTSQETVVIFFGLHQVKNKRKEEESSIVINKIFYYLAIPLPSVKRVQRKMSDEHFFLSLKIEK